MMRAVLARLGALIACVLILITGTAPGDAQAETIRVGVTAGDAFAEAFYAQELGFFKRAGLRVEIRQFSTGAAISTGMTSGSIDVGISNVLNVSKAVARGAPFVLIAGGGLYSSQSPIVALATLKKSPLRQAQDLEGKTVAVTALGDVAQVAITAWTDRGGANIAKVHFIEIPWAEMHAALQSGLAQCAVLTEPWLSAAIKAGDTRVVARPYDLIDRRFLIGVWFTTSSWYAKNRAVAKRFADVIYETARWANAHHEESAQLLAKYSKIDVRTTRSMERAPYALALDFSLIQPLLNLAYRYHTVARPIDANSLIAR